MLNADVLAKAPYKIIEQKQFGELLNFVNAFLMFFSISVDWIVRSIMHYKCFINRDLRPFSKYLQWYNNEFSK